MTVSDRVSRRNVLKATAGLLVGASTAGCTGSGSVLNDLSIREHDTLPTRARNFDERIEIGLSGAVLYARPGAGAHECAIARLNPGIGSEWTLDVVDLIQYGHDDEPECDLRAEDLAEGSTVVFLSATNERGTVVSPDAQENPELNALLPD